MLNIFKALCLENIILYFFRLVETEGLSEIEVTTDFKQQTLRFKKSTSLCWELSEQAGKGANRNLGKAK